MVKKLTADMADPPRYPATFAAHCLRFFDDPSPEMVALVGHQLDLPGSGARVLEAICDLAWKIYLPSKISERQSDREVERQTLPGRPIRPPGSGQF